MSEAAGWLDSLPGVRRGESLAPHTTYRIGGPAEWYLETAERRLLAEAVSGCRQHGVPLLALGNGSNLLVSDRGVEGLVLRPTDNEISLPAGSLLYAAAGARMVKVAQAAGKAGLTGMEWALGIPGTVGGSVANNAGCFGGDIAGTVVEVNAMDGAGEESGWAPASCGFRYRGSAFRGGPLDELLVVGALFRLEPGPAAAIKARMDEVQRERHRTQPVSGRSTGSVFKNPPGDHAGRLVDAAGLRGRSLGGAMVSREHANFIVNTGSATAADVAQLVSEVQAEVRRQFDVELEPEMEMVGRWDAGS